MSPVAELNPLDYSGNVRGL